MFGGPATFSEYVSPRFDDFSQAIGASSDGRCAFHALAHAVRLFGRSDWFSMLTVDAFYNERTQAGNPIYATGVMWTTVWAFIRRNNRLARVSGGSEICEDTVSVNRTQFRLTGVQTQVAAFALEVTWAGRFAYDDSVVREPLLEYVAPWLAALRFVRRVLIR
ncbi:hypothetical protein PC112_g9702 [Phytophthora cactorum]|nr:hypothetical protein PC112_g9702 [Phytophthora cactorum]